MKNTHSRHASAESIPLKLQSEKLISRWQGSISIFNGLTNTKPVKEQKNLPWGGISTEVCPPRPLITKDKVQGQQYISCLLKEESLIGKTLEEAQKSGGQTIGKMRSRNHVTESSFLTLEFDGILEADFIAGLGKLEENSFTYKAWTTFSYGDPDRPGMYARIVIPIDRILAIDEYNQAFNGLNEHFFDGKADPSGAKLYQPQGVRCCHPSRVEQSKTWENFRDLASANALIQIGRSLQSLKEIRPVQSNPVEPGDEKLTKLKKLLNLIDPDVGYSDWSIILMVIFNETGGSNAGLELADDWSRKGEKYKGLGEIENKWQSFNLNHENPVTIATLCKIVKDSGRDLHSIPRTADQELEYYDEKTDILPPLSGVLSKCNTNTPTQEIPLVPATIPDKPTTSHIVGPINCEEIIAELAAMNPMNYDRVRADKAKDLGVQLKTLDRLVKDKRNKKTDSGNSPFDKTQPWPEPVNLEQLLDEMYEIVRRYIVLDPEEGIAAALWVAHTHLIDVFGISPIAIINAPEKACGKTMCQKVLALLCDRPMFAANITESALFRAVELWRPTLFIDEADTFFRDKNDLKGMVNAGYAKDGVIWRTETIGDSFIPRSYSVYCAKSVAGIALERHLTDATMSRGIVINMRRKRSDEKVERLRNADMAEFDVIKSKLMRFAQDYVEHLRNACPALPDELSDRDQDKWEPLLAIAECASDKWLKRATEAALKLSNVGDTSLCKGAELLTDIQEIFHSDKHPRKISTAELIKALCEDEEAPWETYNYGKPITPKQLASLLKPYGIKSKTVRLDRGNTPKGYDAEQFQDAFDRYIPVKKESLTS